MDLLVANIIYVAYRLIISAPLVAICMKYMPYYAAVFVMAQVSFAYDNINFFYYYGAETIDVASLLVADIFYTVRVLGAWYVIAWFWELLDNYLLSVLVVAELTFVIDYFIIGSVY